MSEIDTDTVEVAYHLTARQASACLAVKRKLSAAETFNLAELIEARVGGGAVPLSEVRAAVDAVAEKTSYYELKLMKAASARVVVA